MGKAYYELSDGKSHKFWEIEVKGKGVTVRYGKVGAAGQMTVKTFGSASEAKAHAEKVTAERQKKGYEPGGTGSASTIGGKPAASGARRKGVLTVAHVERWLEDEDSVDLAKFTAIDDDAASALGKLKGDVYLNGLKSLSEGAAARLGKFKGATLSLGGLKFLSESAAAALGKCKGDDLYLDGIKSLSEGAAAALAKFEGDSLFLDGLTKLSEGAAAALGKFKGDSLFLNGLKSLSEESAAALGRFNPLADDEINFDVKLSGSSTEIGWSFLDAKQLDTLREEGLSVGEAWWVGQFQDYLGGDVYEGYEEDDISDVHAQVNGEDTTIVTKPLKETKIDLRGKNIVLSTAHVKVREYHAVLPELFVKRKYVVSLRIAERITIMLPDGRVFKVLRPCLQVKSIDGSSAEVCNLEQCSTSGGGMEGHSLIRADGECEELQWIESDVENRLVIAS